MTHAGCTSRTAWVLTVTVRVPHSRTNYPILSWLPKSCVSYPSRARLALHPANERFGICVGLRTATLRLRLPLPLPVTELTRKFKLDDLGILRAGLATPASD
jgi:hypothetical protein